MERLIALLDRVSTLINRVLTAIAGTVLVLMVVLGSANVALRGFGLPIQGTFEMMGFFGAITAAFALGRTQIKREHIAVDVVIQFFPSPVRRFLSGVSYVIGAVFFALAAWQTALWGTNLWRVNELSETLRIIYFPFVYCVSLGCLVLSLVLFIDMLKVLNGTGEVHS
ncbi:MAG: TRAP transporter small permease [Deltaproteobacteria bacterium]|nr:TRAP transporter small permease [Deltaproteobacteria bacterium]